MTTRRRSRVLRSYLLGFLVLKTINLTLSRIEEEVSKDYDRRSKSINTDEAQVENSSFVHKKMCFFVFFFCLLIKNKEKSIIKDQQTTDDKIYSMKQMNH